MKILITAATSATAHKLKGKFTNDAVLLGDHADLPAFMHKNIIKLPHPASAAYTHEMLKLSLDNDIDTIYLLREEEINVLKVAGQLFKEYNINIRDGRNDL